MKILVVDDIAENLDMLGFLLKSSGYDIATAKNGKEALEKARSESFDLIISDILMPVMDGFQLCKACKEDPALAPVSFIFYSATYIDDKDIEFALSLGAQRFMIKPQEPEVILRVVTEVLDESTTNAPQSPQTPMLDEKEVYKLYSERLVRKLEQKIGELETEVAIRHRTEEDLKQSEKRFYLAVEGSSDGIWDWSINNGTTYFSPRWKSMLGYAESEVEDNYDAFCKLLHPDDVNVLENKLQSYFTHESDTFECEFRMRCHDGSYKWILGRGKALFDENGKPYRMAGSHTDISQRVRQLEELNKLSNAVNFSPVLVAITNSEGIVEYVNPRFSIVTGYEPHEVIGKRFRLFSSDFALGNDTSPDELWKAINSGKIWKGEVENINKNGEIYWESVLIAPITDHLGATTNFVIVEEDITENKEFERKMIAAKERAEESERLKSAFLANMSHEIRTPMNGILGFAGLLKDAIQSGEDIGEYVAIIERSGKRMLNIINDLIEISKVESSQVAVHLESVNLNDQLDFVVRFFKPETEKKGIRLINVQYMTDKEATILTDKDKVVAVLTNLMKNAVKYTDSGRIELGYRQINEFIEFYVLDTGVGIPNNKLEAIFERFVQVDSSMASNYEGAGLGLSIAKAYAEMLGGTIRVESKVGVGSVFYFTLPHIVASGQDEHNTAQSEIPASDEPDKRGLTLLIAEDDEYADLLITKIIRKICSKVYHANNGVEAVRICRENQDIDMVLMDIKMPIMSGYEATKEIRKFNPDITIIAQTAYSMPGDKEKVLAAGCNDYISKPIINDKLLAIIKKYQLPE